MTDCIATSTRIKLPILSLLAWFLSILYSVHRASILFIAVAVIYTYFQCVMRWNPDGLGRPCLFRILAAGCSTGGGIGLWFLVRVSGVYTSSPSIVLRRDYYPTAAAGKETFRWSIWNCWILFTPSGAWTLGPLAVSLPSHGVLRPRREYYM